MTAARKPRSLPKTFVTQEMLAATAQRILALGDSLDDLSEDRDLVWGGLVEIGEKPTTGYVNALRDHFGGLLDAERGLA